MGRPRRLVLVAAALIAALAAGCGGSSSPKASSTTVPGGGGTPGASVPTTTGSATTAPAATTPAPSPSATTATTPAATSTVPAGPGPCPTSQLSLALSGANGTAGSTYVLLNLRNNGPSVCTLSGFPGVSFVTGSKGTQTGAPATRDTSVPVTTVTVSPGHAAQSQLRLIDPLDFDPAACQLTTVQGFRVYPPGQTAAAFVSNPGQACASPSIPQPQLYVGPVQPGPANG
jgi:hypothetical protein